MKRIIVVLSLSFTVLRCGPYNPLTGFVERNRYNGKFWYVGDVFPDANARSLALAAARGNVEKIRELQKKGVDVNYRGKEGITPLLWAIYAWNKEGFEELLKLGANPNVTTDKDSAAMDIMQYAAEDEEDWRFLELILKYGGDPNYVIPIINEPLIHNVCDHGSNKRLQLVVAAGADLNARDGAGMTPIMSCLVHLQYDKALYLLAKGAKYDNSIVNAQDKTFSYLLAAESRIPRLQEQVEARKKVIAFLAEHGIKVKEKERKKQPPARLFDQPGKK